MMSAEILYLKIDRNIKAKKEQLFVKDIASILCSNSTLQNRISLIRIPTSQIKGPGRYVYSVLEVISAIQEEYPNLEICSLGESDFIITVEKDQEPGTLLVWMKTAAVCLLSFFGAAFSIMAFNNDVDLAKLFRQLYGKLTGTVSDGFTLLEITYSIGVGLGILVFFHHFSRKKQSADPTPLEVEMRTYEDDVDTTVIEADGRQEKNRNRGQ